MLARIAIVLLPERATTERDKLMTTACQQGALATHL